jgi:LSD1 subclass zinc finger protein
MEAITESVACNNCGAPLQVPSGARYVNCNHCGAQLAIQRTDSVTFTEALEKIQKHAENLTEQVADIRRQNEVAQLDRDWQLERENFMVSDKHGHRSIPTETSSAIGGVVVVVFGLIWTSAAASIGGGFIAMFGIVFIAFGVFVSLAGFQKAKGYRQAERRYRTRRHELSIGVNDRSLLSGNEGDGDDSGD